MKRKELIESIVSALAEGGALEDGNYSTYEAQEADVYDIIESVLDDYVIVKGTVVEKQ